MFRGGEELNGLEIILLGLVVLIVTPVAMVIANLLRFVHERNYPYVVLTLVVLINLTVAILVLPNLVK